MEGCRQRKSRVELFPDSFPKGTDKYRISVGNNGRQEAIMFPHMFKEELSICCVVVVFLHGMSISILENLSTTTKIVSC